MDSDRKNVRIISDGMRYKEIADSFHDYFESLRGFFFKPGIPLVNILLKDDEFEMKKFRQDDRKIVNSLLGEIHGNLDSYDVHDLMMKSKHFDEYYGILPDVVPNKEDDFRPKEIIGLIPLSEKAMQYCSNIGTIYAMNDRPRFNLVLVPKRDTEKSWLMKFYTQTESPGNEISDLFSGLFNP